MLAVWLLVVVWLVLDVVRFLPFVRCCLVFFVEVAWCVLYAVCWCWLFGAVVLCLLVSIQWLLFVVC